MRVLHEVLRPPEGYELDCAVGTTFTLDLISLLSIPLAVGRFAGTDGGPADTDPLELLASLERSADKVTVFHQAGLVRVPERHRNLLTLVQGCLAGVALRNGVLFHPKVWIARYAGDRSGRHHRVIVLSRNLTPDRCWDTLVVLEGSGTRSKVAESRPLGDFLRWLGRQPGLPPDRRAVVDDLAQSVVRGRFSPPAPFDSIHFRPLGISRHRSDPIASARRDRVLVVSPYLGEDELRRLSAGTSQSILVTRPEELAPIHEPASSMFASILQLDDALEPEPNEEDETPRTGLFGLHAKLYCADQGWGATVWTGSSNATRAGFSSNVEFMVELTGRKGVCGINALLGDEAPGTFSSILRPIEETPDRAPDDELDGRLDALATLVADLPIEAVADDFGARWRLELHLTEPAGLPVGVSVRTAPLTSTAAPRPLDLDRSPVATFDGLADHEVSGLFFVELSLDEPRATRAFVARWPLRGDIPDAVRALLRLLVTDREKLVAFLRLLLGMPDGSVLPIGPGTGNGAGSAWTAVLGGGDPPFELLVRTLASQPERLDAIARWIPELAAAAGGDAGTELLAIWEPIWEARQEQR
jgi:hypothetical protein